MCGHSQVPGEALRTVVIATRLMDGVLTLTISQHMEAFRVDLSCSGKPVGVPNVQGMSWT